MKNGEEGKLKFEEWLTGQHHREDSIGDLARVLSISNLAHKVSRRKSNEHKSWVDIILSIPEPGYIYVFNEAWQEFLLAKQSAGDSPD